MKIITTNPPVYCETHGAFLEECDLGLGDCVWYYDAQD
jgi:hypothetical protein